MTATTILRSALLAVTLVGASAPVLSAQQNDTYTNAGAAELVARARAFRDAADSSILSYSGTVRTRFAAGLRMPLKDRTMYRRESSARIRWSRDSPSVMKMLSFREQTPDGLSTPSLANAPSLDELFDPTEDRIYFGLADDKKTKEDIWIEHPLGADAEQYYRYARGDSLSIRLQDGRTIRSIELRVTPRTPNGHVVTGSLWIDPDNGTVVQALYRLARPLDVLNEVIDEEDRDDAGKIPGMFKPLTFDISFVAIEYGLHEYKYWLPRVMRLEGSMRAGVIRAPASYEISYDIEEVVSASPAASAVEPQLVDSITAAWTGRDHLSFTHGSRDRQARVLMPRDSMSLLSSPDLPPPIWEKTAQFMTSGELSKFEDRLAQLAGMPDPAAFTPTFVWGLGGADLLRYNRVEALSIGARTESRLPFAALSATARIGWGDFHPNVELAAIRSTPRRILSLRLMHALASMDPHTGGFGFGNSASALLLGRDDGEYYRMTGATLTIAPAEQKRSSYDVTFFAQHDGPVSSNTAVTLQRVWDHDFRFRPNVQANSTELAGATLAMRPWWGTDPFSLQGGLDLMIEGATGGHSFARARVTARTAIPLGMHNRIGFEAGIGTSEGDVPLQRLWYVGGANTLRGYDGSTLSGASFARARVDFARTTGWGGVVLFSDAGWAGERTGFIGSDVLYSAGVGTTLLDGLLRMDLAHALNTPESSAFHPQSKWRIELYLDALL